jgi:lycopene beta-cyclase
MSGSAAVETWDYLIAGGGAAGMSLACHLLRAGLGDRRLLLVDRDPRDDERRTFSYWTRTPTAFDDIRLRSWSRLRVCGAGYERTFDLGDYRYETVRGGDFQRRVRGMLAGHPGAELREGTVEEIRDGAESAWAKVDGRWLRARWVFDSVPDRRDFAAPAGGILLRQRFRGWEVETPDDRFDPETPVFFDFRTPQDGAVRFFYLLPYESRRALVEYVSYGPDVPREAMRTYVEETLGIPEYRVVYDESGASPLADRVSRRRRGRRVLRIGMHGGRLKASTGYAFVRILRDSAAIVRSLERRGHPFAVPNDRWRYRFLDALMLRMMVRQAARIPDVFQRMFARNPIGRVLRFLDEEAGPAEILRLGLTLPIAPFLRTLLRWGIGRKP